MRSWLYNFLRTATLTKWGAQAIPNAVSLQYPLHAHSVEEGPSMVMRENNLATARMKVRVNLLGLLAQQASQTRIIDSVASSRPGDGISQVKLPFHDQ